MKPEEKTLSGAALLPACEAARLKKKRLLQALGAALVLHVLGAAVLSLTGFKVSPVKPPAVIELDLTAPISSGSPRAVKSDPVAAPQTVPASGPPLPASSPVVTETKTAPVPSPEQITEPGPEAKAAPANEPVSGSGSSSGTGTSSGGSESGAAAGQGGSSRGTAAPEPSPPVSDGVPVTPPNLLSAPEPAYPESLLAKNIEGTVNVGMTVNASGGVDSAYVAGSSGYPAMDSAAVNVAYRWRFSPAKDSSGTPCACTVTLPVSFALN